MRSALLMLALGAGFVVAAFVPATACDNQAATAANDHASTTQTAQAQPPAQDGSN